MNAGLSSTDNFATIAERLTPLKGTIAVTIGERRFAWQVAASLIAMAAAGAVILIV